MKNDDRIEGLRAVQSQFAEHAAEVARLNAEMRAFVADPGERETASERADEMMEPLRRLLEDRKRILGRLTELDPVFSAKLN